MARINKNWLFLVVILLASILFYWFYIRVVNLRQKDLEKEVQILKKQIQSQSQNDKDSDRFEKEIDNLKYQIEDSSRETQQYLEDELNNQANCERFGGKYQGGGLCVYH